MAPVISMPGYARLRVNGTRGLAVEGCQPALQSILASETLYSFAARQPDARRFAGRAPAYAITLPGSCGDVVVRHAMRGGALARTGSDLFFPPTRGLREAINSLRLRLGGVPTPEVIAFVTYRAGPILRRSDVATREIAGGHDLSVVLTSIESGEQRDSCIRAVGRLLGSLTRAGAHHPDLNIRNILVTWEGANGAHAHVLDVDRIRFHVPDDPTVAAANLARLERSIGKWRDSGQISISSRDIELLRASATLGPL
ncbi:MAG: hypothetical protein H0U59_08530 [Gemmatimonadaceae bacterium]|nr:hypothetical protein [Gemmatimonadaceae bacterium]MDQ3242567.1 lipopolysaccharide kinase InaA family protein [Gemmatimonadota bacterium]